MNSIDMEHHFLSQEFYDYLTSRTEPPCYMEHVGVIHRKGSVFPANDMVTFNPPYTSLEESRNLDDIKIEIMDRCGTSNVAISSIDGFEELPKDDCIRIVKATNDEIAAAAKKHPDRFFGTFCLPTPYVE